MKFDFKKYLDVVNTHKLETFEKKALLLETQFNDANACYKKAKDHLGIAFDKTKNFDEITRAIELCKQSLKEGDAFFKKYSNERRALFSELGELSTIDGFATDYEAYKNWLSESKLGVVKQVASLKKSFEDASKENNVSINMNSIDGFLEALAKLNLLDHENIATSASEIKTKLDDLLNSQASFIASVSQRIHDKVMESPGLMVASLLSGQYYVLGYIAYQIGSSVYEVASGQSKDYTCASAADVLRSAYVAEVKDGLNEFLDVAAEDGTHTKALYVTIIEAKLCENVKEFKNKAPVRLPDDSYVANLVEKQLKEIGAEKYKDEGNLIYEIYNFLISLQIPDFLFTFAKTYLLEPSWKLAEFASDLKDKKEELEKKIKEEIDSVIGTEPEESKLEIETGWGFPKLASLEVKTNDDNEPCKIEASLPGPIQPSPIITRNSLFLEGSISCSGKLEGECTLHKFYNDDETNYLSANLEGECTVTAEIKAGLKLVFFELFEGFVGPAITGEATFEIKASTAIEKAKYKKSMVDLTLESSATITLSLSGSIKLEIEPTEVLKTFCDFTGLPQPESKQDLGKMVLVEATRVAKIESRLPLAAKKMVISTKEFQLTTGHWKKTYPAKEKLEKYIQTKVFGAEDIEEVKKKAKELIKSKPLSEEEVEALKSKYLREFS